MSSESFDLHPVLKADCHRLGRLGSARLLLHRNARLHWFILVPQTPLLDLLDLPAAETAELMREAKAVSSLLKQRFAYPRVNVGALGLLVPQLHLHVIGRREGDGCWPQPVWGNLAESLDYEEHELDYLRNWVESART
ncbi:MAG: HIT domain-containing protein [Congregibacter sp.]